MENREYIDQHLKNSLLGIEVQPRITSFDQVMQKLEKRKRRRILIFFLSGLITLAGLVTVTTSIKNNEAGSSPVVASEKHINPSEKSNLSSAKTKSNFTPAKKATANTLKTTPSPQKTADKKIPAPATQPVIVIEPTNVAANGTDQRSEETSVPQEVVVNETVEEPDELTAVNTLQPHSMMIETDTQSKSVDDKFLVPALAAESTQAPKKKKNAFFIGLHFSPQISTLHFSENPNRDARYDTDGGAYAAGYLKTRQDLNAINISHSLGLKFGMLVSDRWEFLGGLGLQKWKYEEKIYLPSITFGNNLQSAKAFNYNTNSPTEWSDLVMNELNYVSFSLEANRIWRFRSLNIKAGGGFALQHLYSSNVITVSGPGTIMIDSATGLETRGTLVTPFLKAGIIEDLGPRFSFHVSPFVYYNPYSSFNKEYIIKQKFYGLGIEAMILLRL